MKDDLCMRKGDREKNMMSCVWAVLRSVKEKFLCIVLLVKKIAEKNHVRIVLVRQMQNGARVFSGWRAERQPCR